MSATGVEEDDLSTLGLKKLEKRRFLRAVEQHAGVLLAQADADAARLQAEAEQRLVEFVAKQEERIAEAEAAAAKKLEAAQHAAKSKIVKQAQEQSDRILTSAKDARGQIEEDSAARSAKVDTIMNSIDIFESIKPEKRRILAKSMELVTIAANENIITEGEDGDAFYIIESGTVQVLKKDEVGIDVKLVQLKARDYFGELALLQNDKRAATVQAISEVNLLKLSREDFTLIIGPLVAMIRFKKWSSKNKEKGYVPPDNLAQYFQDLNAELDIPKPTGAPPVGPRGARGGAPPPPPPPGGRGKCCWWPVLYSAVAGQRCSYAPCWT